MLLDDGAASTEHAYADFLGVDHRQPLRAAVHHTTQPATELDPYQEKGSATSADGPAGQKVPLLNRPWVRSNFSSRLGTRDEDHGLEENNSVLPPEAELHEDLPEPASLNPWIIAKMKPKAGANRCGSNEVNARAPAPSYQQLLTPQTESRVSRPPPFHLSTPARPRHVGIQSPHQFLPSPESSSPLRGARSSKRPRLQRPDHSGARSQRPSAAIPYISVNTVGVNPEPAQGARAPQPTATIPHFMVPANSAFNQDQVHPHRDNDSDSRGADPQLIDRECEHSEDFARTQG